MTKTNADWETKFHPLLTDELQAARKSEATTRCKVDEVLIRVGKKWHYLYRGIDSDGKLVDIRLSKEYNVMRGFKKFENAERFCRAFEELKEHFR